MFTVNYIILYFPLLWSDISDIYIAMSVNLLWTMKRVPLWNVCSLRLPSARRQLWNQCTCGAANTVFLISYVILPRLWYPIKWSILETREIEYTEDSSQLTLRRYPMRAWRAGKIGGKIDSRESNDQVGYTVNGYLVPCVDPLNGDWGLARPL